MKIYLVPLKKGDKRGNVTILEKPIRKGRYYYKLRCLCVCGTIIYLETNALVKNPYISCGCKRQAGMKRKINKNLTPEKSLYQRWSNMKRRCENSEYRDYHLYGERGIKVCTEWSESFQVFYDWAANNGYKKNLQIDRIDTNGNYEPNNCRWVTVQQNAWNRRNKLSQIKYKGVIYRYNRYISKIFVQGKQITLGNFTDPVEAAKAYDKAAIKYYGEYAHLNFK